MMLGEGMAFDGWHETARRQTWITEPVLRNVEKHNGLKNDDTYEGKQQRQ